MSKYSSSHIFPRKPPALSGEATDISYKGRQCMIVLYFTGRQHGVPINRLRQFLIRDGRGCGEKGEAVKKQ